MKVIPTGAPAPSFNQQIDWKAFLALQERRGKTPDSAQLDYLGRASDDLLKNPNRSATGIRLAKNLTGSARKAVLRKKKQEREAALFVLSPVIVPTQERDQIEADGLRNVEQIFKGIDGIPERERKAVLLKAIEVPEAEIQTSLGVKARQLRNLVRAGRAKLRQNKEAHYGFRTLLENLTDCKAALEVLTSGVEKRVRRAA